MNQTDRYRKTSNEKRITDKHRPIYHFSPDNWMNDPIPFFKNDEYHLFFQYNPNGAFWGTMHWGHIFSKDLVHWNELPIALTPSPNTPDQDGCFTGCVFEEGNKYHILYTGIPMLTPLQQTQCLAMSDDLINWEKYRCNPLNVEKPDGYGECFRDPCVWKENNTWYMIVGGEKLDNKGGAAFLYKSKNLFEWRYKHTLFAGNVKKSGHDFECPDFFFLHDKYVLITSRNQTWWHVGTYQEDKFTMEKFGTVDGGVLYAAKTLLDNKGRRILWGWIREERSEAIQKDSGWSGVLSLPRELTLRPDGRLSITPVYELKVLRGKHQHFNEIFLSNNSKLHLEEVKGDALEILVKFSRSSANRFGLIVKCTSDLSDGVEISYNHNTKNFITTPLDLKKDQELTMQIYIDRSVIEAFANNIACHTLRVYPDSDNNKSLALFSSGGETHIESIDVWEMKSI